jgi:O-antigen biosynthesis protein
VATSKTQTNSATSDMLVDLVRVLAPLVIGRHVKLVCSEAFDNLASLDGATSVKLVRNFSNTKFSIGSSDALICLEFEEAENFVRHQEIPLALMSGAIIAVWCLDPSPKKFLKASHTAHYAARSIAGAVISDVKFSRSRVVALRDGTAGNAPDLHLLLWSESILPALHLGLYENSNISWSQASKKVELGDKQPPFSNVINSDSARAVALAGRLLSVENRTVALRGEIMQLKSRLSSQEGPTGQQGFFDVPRTHHSWPLAEKPTRLLGTLGLYDKRPDDAVIQEAHRGVSFMEAYALQETDPDFGGAVSSLNNMERAIGIDPKSPVVSIIIPVYGQLPYTLNCLDSLLRHSSKFSVEIIVVDDCSPDGSTEQFIPLLKGVDYLKQLKNGGFIRSCNSGGEVARGRYILLLNNDTRVVDGWLDELIGSFSLFPHAGLVGSKMLYPDGSLQEAGGIIWRDGSAWNYGRGDDPNRPQYCFARQVDYISGCSIAIPTDLWRSISGFDPHYTPAYAEDADLCQRIIEKGLEVWFQPTSRVVHYEGKTSGTSTNSGAKAYQIVNMKKLFMRWRARFETHRRNGEAQFFEKEREVRKRLLFVDAVTPTPNQDAGSVQTVLGIRTAMRCGYKTHFVPQDNWLFEPSYTSAMQREGVECAYAPFELGFENYIRRYGWLFDAVIVYRVGVMAKCLELLREFAPGALVIFHLADLHYLRLQRQARLEANDVALRDAEKVKETELAMVRLSDCTITHSTLEAEILAQEAPVAPVTIWPLMVDVVGTKASFDERRDICFLGGYRHTPNVDAVIYFTREIFPLIKATRPEMRFIVAGANPTTEILELVDESIIVTGMVEDLGDVLDRVRVFVCPLRVGAGAKGKVMSALSYGLPIVSTSVGVEGAGLTEGKHFLLADTPSEMAKTVLRVYEDNVLWQSLSNAGLALLREEFSLEMGAQKLNEAVDKAYRHALCL